MKYQDRKNYYKYLFQHDVIGKVSILLEDAGFYIDETEDYKLNVIGRMPVIGYGWHHTLHSAILNCGLWHKIMFDVINIIPSNCQECYKVVVKPKNLKQLFALLDLQLALNLPCKCGIEKVRPTVHTNYGGYFYNKGLENGLKCYKTVKEAIGNDQVLSVLLDEVDVVEDTEIPKRVILKRGCTEFENKFGRSDMWKVTDEQLEQEKLITDTFVDKSSSATQPQRVIDYIHKLWIEYAYEHEDDTYLEFTDDKFLYNPVVTYHHFAEGLKPKKDSSGLEKVEIKVFKEDKAGELHEVEREEK